MRHAIGNHCHALALYVVWYSFARIHKTLRVSPTMAAGVMDRLWDMADIVNSPLTKSVVADSLCL